MGVKQITSWDFCFSARFGLLVSPCTPMQSQGCSSVSSTSPLQKTSEETFVWVAERSQLQEMACLWYRIAYPERMGKLGLATPGLAQVLPSCSPTCCNKYKYLCVSSRSILSPSCLFVCLFWHPKELRRPSIEKRQILKPYDQQRLVFTSTGLLNGTSGTAWWLVSAGNVLQTLSKMGVDRTFSRILDSPSQFCHPVVSGSFAWDELWWGLQKPPLDHCCRNICTCILLSWAKVSPLKTIFFPIQASSVCDVHVCRAFVQRRMLHRAHHSCVFQVAQQGLTWLSQGDFCVKYSYSKFASNRAGHLENFALHQILLFSFELWLL